MRTGFSKHKNIRKKPKQLIHIIRTILLSLIFITAPQALANKPPPTSISNEHLTGYNCLIRVAINVGVNLKSVDYGKAALKSLSLSVSIEDNLSSSEDTWSATAGINIIGFINSIQEQENNLESKETQEFNIISKVTTAYENYWSTTNAESGQFTSQNLIHLQTLASLTDLDYENIADIISNQSNCPK